MRTTKTVTLIVALVLGALALQLISPEKVQAADDLEGTHWITDPYDFYFEKGGILEVGDGEGEKMLKGTYRLNGRSVEMTFQGGSHASGTLSGNKMSVKWFVKNQPTEEFILIKN